MTGTISHLEELRKESEPIADAIEDNEDEIRGCRPEDCAACPHGKFQTCFNEKGQKNE